MLIPLKINQISRLIPSVGTGSQFKYALGDPRKILQRLIISSIGGIINFLISISQTGNQTYNLWLLLCVIFFLYNLGPILESSKKNLQFRKYKFASIFDGYVSDIYKPKRLKVQGNNQIGKVD